MTDWKQQIAAPVRIVRTIVLATEHGRYAVDVMRTRFDTVEVFIRDAAAISDEAVRAGGRSPVVCQGPLGDVLLQAHRRGISVLADEREALVQAVGDAYDEIQLRKGMGDGGR